MQFSGVNRFTLPAFKVSAGLIFHVLFWPVYIGYEIVIAALVAQRWGHSLDYLLHYILYIALFYFHCLVVMKSSVTDKGVISLLLVPKIVIEFAAFFSCNLLINMYLKNQDIALLWEHSNTTLYTNIYRFVWVLILSTGYWAHLELVKNLKKAHRLQHAKAIMAKEKETLRADMLQMEVALLRSQINPHMLFNTLNFLYNEVRKVDKPVAEHIMSLSEIMQYSLSADQDQRVTLQEEVNHIENYISLHCKRTTVHVELVKTGRAYQQQILPLMLSTIVENMFHHGDLTDANFPGKISVNAQKGQISIGTKNRIDPGSRGGHGIGLQNLKKRLDHMYPGAYELEHGRDGNNYKLNLIINLVC